MLRSVGYGRSNDKVRFEFISIKYFDLLQPVVNVNSVIKQVYKLSQTATACASNEHLSARSPTRLSIEVINSYSY